MANLIPFAVAWTVLAVIVIVLAIMRKQVAAHEDDSIHLNAGSAAVSEQVDMAKRLESIDKWGKILTAALVVSGLALAAGYGYAVWEASSKAGF